MMNGKLQQSNIYDVAIIGAGPIGSFCAKLLAEGGLSVVLIEEHLAIGEGVTCAGIIGKEAFEQFPLPKDSILNRMNSIKFVSPSGKIFIYESESVLAYIVDRKEFDRALSEESVNAGAKLVLGCRINDLRPTKEEVILIAQDGKTFRSKIAVIATGYGSPLTLLLGMGQPPTILQGAQAEVAMDDIFETEIYLGQEVAPESFAWVVPLGNGRARIGVAIKSNATLYLKRLMYGPLLSHRIKELEDIKIYCAALPLGSLNKTFCNRVIAVGEAAGQLKTTTNGGVYYGLICAKIAAEVLNYAFKKDAMTTDVLRLYEDRWRSKLEKEIKVGSYLRQLFSKFNDEQIDALVEFGNKKEIRPVIENLAKFDWHRNLIMSSLKFSIFKKLLR